MPHDSEGRVRASAVAAPSVDEDTARILRWLLAVSAAAALAFAPFGIALHPDQAPLFAAIALSTPAACLAALVMMKRGRVRAAAWTLVVSTLMGITAFLLVSGGTGSPAVAAVVAPVVLAAMVLGWRECIGFGVAALGDILLITFGTPFVVTFASPVPGEGAVRPVVLTLLVFLITSTLVFFVRSRSRVLDGLRKANSGLKTAANVFRTANEGIAVTDGDCRVVDVNDAYCRMHGRERQEFLGRDVRADTSGRYPPEFHREIVRSLEERGEWSGELWQRRADGSEFPTLFSLTTLADEAGHAEGYVGICTDISEIEQMRCRLRELATHDTLTGLANRAVLYDSLSSAVAHARREEKPVGVLFFDLDRFKQVNDTLGHGKGDDLLVAVADRVTRVMRGSDTLSREGGDEFTVVVKDLEQSQLVEVVARRVLEALNEPFDLGGEPLHVTASMGIAMFPSDGEDPDELLRHADVAMYRAKELGRNRMQFFSSELQSQFDRRVSMENGLRQALRQDELFLLYQPQVDLRTGRVDAVESLVRWSARDGIVVMPDDFIPVAEESGLIIPLGEWVLRRACADASRLHSAGFPDVRVSVNVSARQLHEMDLTRLVTAVLAESGLPPAALELEVTESALMFDVDEAARKLAELRDAEIRLAMDDFGTGYSSLKYVRLFNPDRLKIDRFFVQGVPQNREARSIVLATISLADSLGMETVAEGPETEEQIRFLRDHGCGLGQGYHFSKPVPFEELLELLRRAPFPLPSAEPAEEALQPSRG